jgi:leucyl/phenylalanyl-tRNA--protein transferase
MLACAAPRTGAGNTEDPRTWITQAMLDVYCQLHETGVAHSIECWFNNKLVGGMYGLVLGDIFFGESMFSKNKDASKVAMFHLCSEIKPFLIDAQVDSRHLQTLGAEVIDRQDFIDIIKIHANKQIKLL